MLKIKNEQHLVSLMLATLPEVKEKTVSVVADKDVIVKVMRECLLHNLIEVGFIDIDPFEYDREYMLTLTYIEGEDCIEVDIDKIYLYDKDVYCATDGYILFHEDVNSKAQIDMEENEHVEFESDWFAFDETVESVECDCEECCGCCGCEEHECNDNELAIESDGDMHGFSVSHSDENGSSHYSFYSTNLNLVEKVAMLFR